MSFFQWTKQEFLRVFPVFIFFLISFNLINMTQGLMLKNKGIAPFSFLSIFIAAGVVAKVLVLMDHLPFSNAFSQKPLIWKVLWQTFLYGIGSLLIRFIIRSLPFVMRAKSFILGYRDFSNIIDMKEFLGIQLWYILLFFIFVASKELILIIGPQEVKKKFFGPK